MLSEINKLARQYVPEEPNKLTKRVEYVECIYKISMARIQLADLTAFLDLVIHEASTTFTKASGNFLCAVIWLDLNSDMEFMPKRLGFINDGFYVHLDFCKVRECSKARYDSIYNYYESKYRREDWICV